MRHFLINESSISTVNGHLLIFVKGSFVRSMTKMMDLEDDWSQGLSTDLRPVGWGLVGQGHCFAAKF